MADIRYVSHPLFSRSDALEQIECLKPEPGPKPSDDPEHRLSPIGKLCEEPLLSRRDERYLFLRMNFARHEANAARGEKRSRLLAEATDFRDRILAANLRLLVSVAAQFATPQVRTEELVSEGVLRLMRAVELFDVSRGWAFGTYATHVLRNHFRRTGQKRQRQDRLAVAFGETDLSQLSDDCVPPERQSELAARHHQLVQASLAELSETDRQILRSRFGFDDPASPRLRSYAEVGREVGLSKERVRVRAHRALEFLKETARDRHWEFPELDSFDLRV